MIKVHFRKKTLLGSTVYRAGIFNTPASVFTREYLLEYLRGIVLSVLVAGYFSRACYHLGTI
jgi:hypothetical protein